MPTCLRLLILLLSCALVLPLLADDPPKKGDKKAEKKADGKNEDGKKDEDKKDPKKEEKKKLTWGSKLTGKLTQIDANSQNNITVQVQYQIQVPRPEAQRELAQRAVEDQRRYAEIMRQPNPVERQRALYQWKLEQAKRPPVQMFTVQNKTQDIQVRMTEETIIRTPAPPAEYDAKGNLKAYTLKQLQELRGKEGYPGFPGNMDSLRAGQLVEVYLTKPAPPPKKGPKDKLKVEEDEPITEQRAEAVMIVILREPPMRD